MVDSNDINRKAIRTDAIEWKTGTNNCIRFDVARFDEIHPIVSGNKYYKLRYNLQETIAQNKKGIITMGGAYSNHLAATAFACREAGLQSAAFIRGEVTNPLNPTLSFCQQNGMELIATPRSSFHRQDLLIQTTLRQWEDFFFVPEGGDNAWGCKGAAEMLEQVKNFESYTHLIVAIGTGTTIKGIADAALPHQQVIGVPVIKIKGGDQEKFSTALKESSKGKTIDILFEFSGKGYARTDETLFQFMNHFYKNSGIPTDFVYTAKLMLAVISYMQQSCFPKEHKVLVIHSGGLQGNHSLPAGTLIF